MAKSLRERFEVKVPDRPEIGCWFWVASTNRQGYGQIMVDLPEGKRTMARAHRVAHELFIGPIPVGKEVEHVCETPLCVRWTMDLDLGSAHIAAVTHKENTDRSAAIKRNGGHNRAKTHCPSRHEYLEENTYRIKGRRICKTCAITRSIERRKK